LTALAPLAAPARGLAPEEVPSPLPESWVVDLTGTLPPDALDALNREADRVHTDGLGELAVVVIPATDDGDTLGFALRLFDHWGVGDAAKSDGVLLFLSVGDRAAEIVLGEGVDDRRRQAASDRIMQSVMVPRFRRGDLAGGLVDGARAISGELLLTPERTPGAETPYTIPTGAAADTQPPVRRPVPIRTDVPFETRGSGGGWFGLVLLLVVILVVVWMVVRLSRAHRPAEAGAGSRPGFFTRVFQSYKLCPECGEWQRTRRRRVIDHATTWSTGLAEILYSCPVCGDEELRTKVIPREPDPRRYDDESSESSTSGKSSLFGGGSSSSRSSSSRSSSSRSSSRPSSFGGGRSRGGGSSGRW
jgi:uncharacterized protein